MIEISKSLVKYSDKDEIDVVMFPEMGFTGYTFIDANDLLTLNNLTNENDPKYYVEE